MVKVAHFLIHGV